MTLDDLPDAPDPANDPPATFSLKAAAMVLSLKNMIVQLRAAFANLNSVAAGGAYAIPYKISTNIANAGKGGYLTLPNNGFLYFDDTDTRGAATLATLTNAFASTTSGAKAYVKFTVTGDPSRWALYSVTSAYAHGSGGNGNVVVTYIANVGTIAEGEAVVAQITPTGNAGSPGAFPTFRAQHQGPLGTSGGSSVVGANTRTLNTVARNTLTGASLASNQITLPAGVYKVSGSAPALLSSNHQAYLYSITAGAVLLSGTVESSNGSYSTQTRSFFAGEITLSAVTVMEMRHSIATAQATSGLGQAYSTSYGGTALFAEILFEKIG
jgi:hypothetical protein